MGKPLRHLLAAMAAVMLAALTGCGSGSGTRLPVLAIVSTAPADTATGVHLGATISATFNQQMNQSTVNDSTFVLSDPSGALVVGSVTYDSASFTATFTPLAPLAPNTVYMAGISSGVTNIADTPLPNDTFARRDRKGQNLKAYLACQAPATAASFLMHTVDERTVAPAMIGRLALWIRRIESWSYALAARDGRDRQ